MHFVFSERFIKPNLLTNPDQVARIEIDFRGSGDLRKTARAEWVWSSDMSLAAQGDSLLDYTDYHLFFFCYRERRAWLFRQLCLETLCLFMFVAVSSNH